MKRAKVAGAIRIDAYKIVTRAVEEGVRCGMSRAHKHTGSPTPDDIAESIEQAVINALCDVLRFGDEEAP